MVVLGSTGLVGGQLTRWLLERDVRVRAPGRRAPDVEHPGLSFEPLDFSTLRGDLDPPAPFVGAAAVAICLGTTLARAGSREAFRRVDLGYVVGAAGAATRAGVPTLAVVSSVGANPRGATFYLRVKGAMEEAVRLLPFRHRLLARPPLLVGEREERRRGEALAARLLAPLGPILKGPLAGLRPIDATLVARAMGRWLLDPEAGTTEFGPDELRARGA